MERVTVKWLGQEFVVYSPASTKWSETCGGVYIFCYVDANNLWKALYVGKCDCFCDRLTNHERWEEAAQLGATHVHAITVDDAGQRDQIEANLIKGYQPPLNSLLK